MVKVSSFLAGVALVIGLSAPALAETVVHRSHVVRHRAYARPLVVRRRVAPVIVATPKDVPLQPGEFVDPANPGYIHGVDDGSRYDTAADGVAVGREPGDATGPRDGSTRRYARSGGPGFEIEGPPIYRSLPVVPELINPELY